MENNIKNKYQKHQKHQKHQKNIYNKKLKICSLNPLTGYNRSGYCETNEFDEGNHLICARMNKKFLDFSEKVNNNLRSVAKEGDKWCLCQNRYYEAYLNNNAPKVINNASNFKIKKEIKKLLLNKSKKSKTKSKKSKTKSKTKSKKSKIKTLPKLRVIDKSKKKYIYKLNDNAKNRRKAIDSGINSMSKRKKITKKQAAISKKNRFNLLRIYRKNNNKKHCKIITNDMKYMDKKYNLGKTTNICK